VDDGIMVEASLRLRDELLAMAQLHNLEVYISKYSNWTPNISCHTGTCCYTILL
jgi:hypothetical protein